MTINDRCTRRDILVGGLAATLGSTALRVAAGATLEATRVISWEPALYHGWPTIARRSTGELLLVFSGGRESHVCPFGRVELMRSQDDGATWRWPQVLSDGPIDDRDAGVVAAITIQPTPMRSCSRNRPTVETPGRCPIRSVSGVCRRTSCVCVMAAC